MRGWSLLVGRGWWGGGASGGGLAPVLTSSSMGLVYCRAAISCSSSACVFFFMSNFCSTFLSLARSPPGGIMGTLFSAQACTQRGR